MFSRHKLLCGNRLGKKNAAIASGCDKPKIGYTRVHFHENMVIHQWMESNYGSSHHFQRCPFSKSMLPGVFPIVFPVFFCAGPGHSLPQATSSSLPERRILVKFPFGVTGLATCLVTLLHPCRKWKIMWVRVFVGMLFLDLFGKFYVLNNFQASVFVWLSFEA
jgi:hypothetical protein